MKTCPKCLKEIPDQDWYCPYCHTRVPSGQKGTGHATMGDFDSFYKSNQGSVSNEDKSMLSDKNHGTGLDEDGIEPEQPYSLSKFDKYNN